MLINSQGWETDMFSFQSNMCFKEKINSQFRTIANKWTLNTQKTKLKLCYTYWLWLMLSTKRLLALASPSGTVFNLLNDKSIVVNSSNSNSSGGMPEHLISLCRRFRERSDVNSVSSPNNFSSRLCFNDKFSSFMSFPISSGISVICVLSNFSHCTPLINRTAFGNLPSCKEIKKKNLFISKSCC